MSANRKYGMDHPHHAWSALPSRPPLLWPNGARLAICIIINLEHDEWDVPSKSYVSPQLSGGLSPRPWPDYMRMTHREYGHRVGIFRVLDALEQANIPPTIAIDSSTARKYPYLIKYCLERKAEFIAHGMSVNSMVTSGMSWHDERKYIRETMDALIEFTGQTPRGWFGPEFGESEHTPRILGELGFRYVCDWPNDEQPYMMTVPVGEITNLPIMLELDDVNALWDRKITIKNYSKMLIDAFDRMYRDGLDNGRLLVLNLHPWLIGQPFRIGYLEKVLAHVRSKKRVWAATGSEIIEWYREQSQNGEG